MKKNDPMKKSIFNSIIVMIQIEKTPKLFPKRRRIEYLPFHSKYSYSIGHWPIFRRSSKLLKEWMWIFPSLRRATLRLRITTAATTRNVFSGTRRS